MTQQIFLIPGFFGFTSLGDLRYFGHVEAQLDRLLRAQGLDFALHSVPTRPTAGLPVRVNRLVECIHCHAGPADPIHLIGHSTGGLDARLLTSPGVAIAGTEAIAERVRSVVTVCTPHHGTPSAGFFDTFQGKQALRLLSAATVVTLMRGRIPLRLGLELGEVLVKLRQRTRGGGELVDELYARLLGEFGPDRSEAVRRFFEDVASDQDLIPQLAPEAVSLLNSTTPDRPGVAYGSVVAMARRPRASDLLKAPLKHPMRHITHGLFRTLWNLASTQRRFGELTPPQSHALHQGLERLPEPQDNDGIVPTLSQPWGRVLRAVDADHLDVLGHYQDDRTQPPHFDWMSSRSGFRGAAFDALWGDVASFVLESSR